MQKVLQMIRNILIIAIPLIISSCASYHGRPGESSASFFSPMPSHINTKEKVVLVDPNVHRWGAYDANGNLIRTGMATAGGNWCPDIGRACRTAAGTFRVNSLGEYGCKSSKYPKPHGGGLMPYCMFFNGSQALHGSPDGAVIEGNISHGCVRLKIPDAEWLRHNFVTMGTKVIIKSY